MNHYFPFQRLLTFWFGAPQEPTFGAPRKFWFASTLEEDADIKETFLEDYEKAAQNLYKTWTETPEGMVALILLLDQIPRNIFRGTPQAFKTDSQALALAEEAIEKKMDAALSTMYRHFLYMPFQHAEDLKTQQRSLDLFQALNMPATFEYAKRHHDIIVRFGRFPHRNAILNRSSTPEEIAFLKEPHSSF